jgi:hypothetical protein
MEIVAYILAPFIASGAIYHLSKPLLDSIWKGLLTIMGMSGMLGEEEMQNAVYHMMRKG